MALFFLVMSVSLVIKRACAMLIELLSPSSSLVFTLNMPECEKRVKENQIYLCYFSGCCCCYFVCRCFLLHNNIHRSIYGVEKQSSSKVKEAEKVFRSVATIYVWSTSTAKIKINIVKLVPCRCVPRCMAAGSSPINLFKIRKHTHTHTYEKRENKK